MKRWRPFAQDVRENWERFVFLVRDARAHRELGYIPWILGVPALWASLFWWASDAQVRAGGERMPALVFLELVAGVPALFGLALAIDMRRNRRRYAAQQKSVPQGIAHGFKRNDLRTYRLVSHSRAEAHGLPYTEHLQEVAHGPDGRLYGIDKEAGEIRPAHNAEDPVVPPPLPKPRHSKFTPLT